MALVTGLPPESATHRKTGFPPVEEMLALLLERQDAWSGTQLQFAAGKRVRPPGQIQIRRPGDEPPPEPKIESDPRAIAAWFAKHVGGR